MRPTRLLALVLAAGALAGCDATAPVDPDPLAPPPGAAASATLFPVRQNGQHALIDSTGRVVVTLERYNSVKAGGEGLVPARWWDGRRNVWDFLNDRGEVVLSLPADDVAAPSHGRIRVSTDGRSGFVDLTGRFVVNPYLNDSRPFREGFARVKTTGWQWGLMTPSGTLSTPTRWGDLFDVSDGRARFRSNNLHGFIDVSGTEVIPAVYADARSFSGGFAAVREGERWGYITPANARAMGGATFISAGDVREGLAPVRTENLWEYVNTSGQRVIGPQFEEARAFHQGRAAVRVDGRWTFVDRSGALIRPPGFDEVEDFQGGLARVNVGTRWGYVNRAGQTVWVPRD